VQFTTNIDENLLRQIKLRAVEESKNVNDILENLMQEYLGQKINIYYTDIEHRYNLIKLLKDTNKVYAEYEVDNYYLCAYYVLCSNKYIIKKAAKFITGDGIRFEDMLNNEDWCSGHKILIKLANELFNNNANVSINNMCNVLDNDNFKVALQAMELKRLNIYLEDL
jgi:hypothetical protein